MPLSRGILLPIPTDAGFGDLHVSHVVKFQPNRTIRGRVIVIPPFLPFLGPHLLLANQSVTRFYCGGHAEHHVPGNLTPITENTQDGGTVLSIANLMVDSESKRPNSHSNFPSCIVSEIFVRPTERQRAPLLGPYNRLANNCVTV